ncbi:MATE family efflux transporter [Dorea sp. Marseille-P4042]|uniref:MATE family efflux transporter n=1 Tax=Dorea sp. Marseille-P4042 TaxID=2080749 RepID=UPI000CF89CA7|nr:MATE family efflux transporter [Dorea sp. Marseille-P4042]
MYKKDFAKEIWKLAYPVALLTLTQRIGSIFEGILLSVHSTEELTISSICGPYISIITTVSYGLAISVNVVMAKIFKNPDRKKDAGDIFKGILLLTFILGILISVVVSTRLYFEFADMTNLRKTAYLYMVPYLLGNPVILLYSILIAAFRGLGDSKTGMWMTFIAVPIQVGTAYLLYKLFGFIVLGYGMILSRITGCVYGILQYNRYNLTVFTHSKVKISRALIQEFVKLAAPISLSKVISPIANVVLNQIMLAMGTNLVAVAGLGNRLSLLFYLPATAVGSAAVTLIAGNNDYKERRQLIKQLCVTSVLPTIVIIIVAFFVRGQLSQMLTADAAMQQAGKVYWTISLWAYPFVAIEMTMTSVLQALGYGFPTLAITIVRLLGVQIPLTYLARHANLGAKGVWGAYVISNVVSMSVSVVWGIKKMKGRK